MRIHPTRSGKVHLRLLRRWCKQPSIRDGRGSARPCIGPSGASMVDAKEGGHSPPGGGCLRSQPGQKGAEVRARGPFANARFDAREHRARLALESLEERFQGEASTM